MNGIMEFDGPIPEPILLECSTVDTAIPLPMAMTDAYPVAENYPLQPGEGGVLTESQPFETPDLFAVLLPRPEEAEGYIPDKFHVSLSGEQARTLARLRMGFVAAGAIPNDTQAALKHLLDIIGAQITRQ